MINYWIIFALGLIASSVTAQDICDGASDGTALPNEYDCEHFYVCVKGKAIAKFCGNGLHFNPVLLFCQEPSVANCVAKTTEGPATTTQTPPTTTETPPTTTETPPTTTQTPPTTTQTPPTPTVTPPTTTQTPPTTTQTPPTTTQTPPTTTQTPPTTTQTPPTTTQTPPTTTQTPPTKPTPPPGSCKGKPLGQLIPYPGDCFRYIVCIGGGVPMVCPDGLHFNPVKEVCDWPESAGCIY